MIIQCTKQTIRKFILLKQLLLFPREIAGLSGIEIIFNNLRAIQYDPQNICGRSIDLSLQARVAGIHPDDYYHWLYEERKGIEAYDKELTVIPIEDLPICRGRTPLSREKKLMSFLEENDKELKKLIRLIKKNGKICSSDISDDRRVDIFWESTKWGKVALDGLWKIGKLVITARKNGRKYYDLPEKVYGNNFVGIPKNIKNAIHEKSVLRRLKSVGVLPVTGTGTGWQGIGTGKEIKIVITELLQQKKVVEVEVEGINIHYIINSVDVELLSTVKKKKGIKKVSFLSPLDNLLWDRKLIKDIFDFDYKWEAYTPEKDRKYGHYVLPILYGDEFIGRIEPKFNKKNGVLEIHGVWIESNHLPSQKDKTVAFQKYLEEFKNYLKAKDIKWLCPFPW